MSLTAVLANATSGLRTAQTGLKVVSDNIANVDTPGYVRKIAEQESRVVAGAGAGVDVARIRRAADAFLQAAGLKASADSAAAGVRSDILDRAQALFGDPSGDVGFLADLNAMYSAFTSAADDPSSAVRRRGALEAVDAFLSDARSVSQSLTALRAETDRKLEAGADRVNALLADISTLNGEIARAGPGQDATGAETVLGQRIDELSSLLDVRIRPRQSGGFEVTTKDGLSLAGGGNAGGSATLAYRDGQLTVTPPGQQAQPLNGRVSSGELKGLLDLRNTELPQVQAQLSTLVDTAVNELNRAHNSSSAVPAPQSLSGRDTGLSEGQAAAGFTGRTTVVLLDGSGKPTRRVSIDFDAGTMSVNGGAATAFMPGTFSAQLTAALGPGADASFANGRLSLSAPAGQGISIADDPAAPASKGGKGFSHFFGLNDLVTAEGGPSTAATGLRGADALGVTGGSMTFQLTDKDGAPLRSVSVTPPVGGDVNSLVTALNDPAKGLSLYGAFQLDAQGALKFVSSGSGVEARLTADTTTRASGPGVGALFQLGQSASVDRVGRFGLKAGVMDDPGRLALAKLDLSAVAAGTTALSASNGAGALALSAAGTSSVGFPAVGGRGAVTDSVQDWAASFAGLLGRRAEAAEQAKTSADAIAAEATARRANAEGVNLDEEIVQMTTYQQAYAASARLIQAAKEMYDVLLQVI